MITDFEPFVRVQPRSEKGTGFYAYLDRCAHAAFVNGPTSQEASRRLEEHCGANEAQIRRSMVVLGLLPKAN